MKDIIASILVSILVIGSIIGVCCIPDHIELTTQDDIEITIKDKERVMNPNDSGSKYLIWSEEGEVFENTDELFLGKFNSSDLYGQLEIGNKYQCHVTGWRNAYMSWYRNLIECKAVEE